MENSIVDKYLKGYYAGYITSTEAIEMIDIINVTHELPGQDVVSRTVSKLTENSIDK